MEDGTPKRLCLSHSFFQWGRFCAEWTGHFRSYGEHTWVSGFGTNTELLRGVIGPISSPNDELNTAFVDVVSLEKSLKKQKITNQN